MMVQKWDGTMLAMNRMESNQCKTENMHSKQRSITCTFETAMTEILTGPLHFDF